MPQQSLEFDGTEAAFAMTTGGIGWAITTPLCLIHGHTKHSGLKALPLSAPVLHSAIYMLVRSNFNETLAAETLSEAKGVLRELLESRHRDLAPSAIEKVHIG